MIDVLGREGIWMTRLFVSVAVGLMALVPCLSHAQVTVDERLALGQPLAVIAHRAVGGGAPENSLAGIQYAIDRGIDMVEVDVRMTGDGHYILMHDPSLARTTNVKEVFPDGAPALGTGDPNARRYRTFDFALEDVARLRLLDPFGGELVRNDDKEAFVAEFRRVAAFFGDFAEQALGIPEHKAPGSKHSSKGGSGLADTDRIRFGMSLDEWRAFQRRLGIDGDGRWGAAAAAEFRGDTWPGARMWER